MPDFILEIYSEEIPSRMQRPAAAEFLSLLTDTLKKHEVDARRSGAAVTPRRLCVDLRGLPEASPASVTVKRGPRLGAPDHAVVGFARAAGVDPDSLEIRSEARGEYYFAVTERPGHPVRDILNEAVPEAMSSFRWPKSMRWGAGPFRWVRPVRAITAVLCDGSGAKALSFSVAGIKAGGRSRGHASMAPELFPFASFDEYRSRLFDRFVIIDSAERETRILDDARRLAGMHSLELVADTDLGAEIAGLVEWPAVMIESVDPKFSALPQDILVTTMRSHQKYLAARNPATGRITHFIVVADREAADGGKVILEGNRMVLDARLDDAVFVWGNDLRRISAEGGIAEMRAGLDRISYHNSLGSLGGKVRRMEGLAADIAGMLGAEREAAKLAVGFVKIDLVSETVGEFPELQGVVGRHFAEALKLDPRTVAACEEHYLPIGPAGRIPSHVISVAVGLADRIDQLAGFFAIGLAPSGSKDPFALRRAALAIIRLCIGNRLRIPLAHVLGKACREYGAELPSIFEADPRHAEDTVRTVLAFVHERLAVHLRSKGIRHDIVSACAAMDDSDDLTLTSARAEALSRVLRTEAGGRLLHGFRRARNILEAEFGPDDLPVTEPRADLAAETEEIGLIAALASADARIKAALAEEQLEEAMTEMAALASPVDRFFEHVRVNASDTVLRCNRLRLLAAVCRSIGAVADLTRIEHGSQE